MQPESDELVEIIRADRRKIAPAAIAALVFVIAGIGLVGRRGGTAIAAGIFAIAFFGAGLVFLYSFLG